VPEGRQPTVSTPGLRFAPWPVGRHPAHRLAYRGRLPRAHAEDLVAASRQESAGHPVRSDAFGSDARKSE
jgi:hypothetical protein